MAMASAMSAHKGCMIQGPNGVGKTETVHGLAKALGHHVAVMQCRSHIDTMALAKLLQGVAVVTVYQYPIVLLFVVTQLVFTCVVGWLLGFV